jgi:hypothetical protein
MLDLAAALKQVRQGMIPAHIYGDPEIFALGRDRLFTRAWVFLAHESEIPDPGDYVVRRVLAARKTCAVARPCRSRSPVRTTQAATCSWPRTVRAGSPAP